MKNLYVLILISTVIFYFPLNAQWMKTHGAFGGQVLSFIVFPNGTGDTNLFAGTENGGVFISSDSGINWTAVGNGLMDVGVMALAVSGSNLFAGTDSGVFLSTNKGTNWKAVNANLPNTSVRALAISPNGAGSINIFAGTYGSGVFLSTDSGTSWNPASNGLMDSYVTELVISSNEVGSTNLFAATTGDIYFSADNGTTWTAVGLKNPFVTCLAISGTNLFAGTWGGVILSTDNGKSWEDVNNGITSNYISAVAIYSNGIDRMDLFAASLDKNIYVSTDNGTRWKVFSDSLPITDVVSFAVLGTNLFAGTSEGDLWRRPLSDIVTSTGQIKNGGLYNSFDLKQNYPNPFNPSTTIKFQVPNSSFVNLKVFDVIGKVVATLVNEEKPAGNYNVEFNGGNLTSGIYFYQLSANHLNEIRKMVLLK